MTMNPVYPRPQSRQAQKRMSWAVCNWDEPDSYSDYDEDECDQHEPCSASQELDEHNEEDIQVLRRIDGEHPQETSRSKAVHSKSASVTFPMAPRPGSLLELILADDAPTISGCERPAMRRRGTMEEKIPPKHDELFYKLNGFRCEDNKTLDHAASR